MKIHNLYTWSTIRQRTASPYLAVVLAPDGTASATPFDTVEKASALNNQRAKTQHGDFRH
jgi:hypothetical protein